MKVGTEEESLKYVPIARKVEWSTSQVLLQLFEMRLNNILILLRLGITLTIP